MFHKPKLKFKRLLTCNGENHETQVTSWTEGDTHSVRSA